MCSQHGHYVHRSLHVVVSHAPAHSVTTIQKAQHLASILIHVRKASVRRQHLCGGLTTISFFLLMMSFNYINFYALTSLLAYIRTEFTLRTFHTLHTKLRTLSSLHS